MENRNTHTILAVDDSPENLDLIKNILEPHYTVKVAVHSELALHIATSQLPDLILLDIMLDDMDGYEICHQLKSSDKTRNIPVIFLTAKHSEEDEVHGFRIGGSDYITKPFSPSIVLARVRTQIQLKTKSDLLEKLASLDGLTEIPNRRAFDTALERQWNQSKRTGMPLSLLIVDIDNFKQFNDYFGHPMGDECLKRVARALQDITHRPEDLVARLGGEEFSILLPNTDSIGALLRAEQYRETIENLRIRHTQSNPNTFVTISVGVATLQAHAFDNVASLLKAADDALYQAKHQGRNRICANNLSSSS
ncbi:MULTISPECIES: diguanylate cyclase domain-containing protein [Methylomonas]|uniref:diguanylate cyclase n=2 Tax=Methylomonas TaxID=416 RepID=A0A126T0V7_9GAMM|nr:MULTISPECIES: diguanylate cyclase [Methylomonas]AMK75716.1 diguanylate cyclase response regulator [Methylomonas denitrificans]OAH98290.1 diguanylate cyclase response regulator [Methylomonas methanica]TCV82457.1 response regulator receiver modulated diguanylate cyclase [Methylomonas methanica]